jgi:peptidoglycan/xylan/chitin deacetylase (PgdA/CDA1 family)
MAGSTGIEPINRQERWMKVNSAPYPGAFVISLDFELHWGLAREFSVDSIRDRLLATRKALPRVLSLFEEYEIHVTWAIVGFLFYRAKEDLIRALPLIRPQVNRQGMSPYDLLPDLGTDEEDDPYHYASSLIDRILATNNQEIASHTFAHCVWDHSPGETTAFRLDLRAALEAARGKGVRIATLVFPRNEYTDELLPVLSTEGLTAFRGRHPYWYTCFDQKHRSKQALFRLLRFVDRHVNVSGPNTLTWGSVANSMPYNIPGGLGLEFYSQKPWLAPLEPLRLKRIQSAITTAARRGEILHLWWHPHQFGGGLQKKIEFLRAVLDHFAALRETYGMESLTMREVAEKCALMHEDHARACG